MVMAEVKAVAWSDIEALEFLATAMRHVEYKRGNPGPTLDDIKLGLRRIGAVPESAIAALRDEVATTADAMNAALDKLIEHRNGRLAALERAARLEAENARLREAVQGVINASRDYLPPDGISKDEFISRVLAATDNADVCEVMK